MNDLIEKQEPEAAANSDEHSESKLLTPQEWECARVEFITTDLTGKQIAEAWGVNYNTLKSQMQRNKWTEGRDSYLLQLSADKIKEKHEERMKAQALLDTNTKMFGASMIESLSAGSKLTTDMSKLAAGVRAYAGVVKLVREANGLALERSPAPDPEPSGRSKWTSGIFRYLTPDGVKYVDSRTNKIVEPTPDAIGIGNSLRNGAAMLLVGFAAVSGVVMDLLLKLVPAVPTIRIDQPIVVAKKIVRPTLRLVPREEPVEAKKGGARKVARVRKVAAGRDGQSDRRLRKAA